MNKILVFSIIAVLLIGTFGFLLFQNKQTIEGKAIPIKVIEQADNSEYALDEIKLKNPRYQNGDLDAIFDDAKVGNVLDFKLKSHPSVDYVKQVGLGNQVVMYYDVNSNYGLANALGEPEFINQRTGELVEREWRYVYYGLQEYESPVYSQTTSANGTIIQEQTGTETKTREAWLPYNSRDIPKGQIRIGIEVNNKEGDYIDGIWNVGGKKISKHAEWDASLENGLNFWWTLNESSGSTAPDMHGGNDGIYTGDLPTAVAGVSSETDKSQYFDGDSDYVNDSDSPVITDMNGAVSVWVKLNATTGQNTIISSGISDGTANPRGWVGFSDGTGFPATSFIDDGNNMELSSGFEIPVNDTWYHVIVNNDEENTTFYINSVLQPSSTNIGDSGKWFGNMVDVDTFAAGVLLRDTATQHFNGAMDELAVWNRSLTSDEVAILYNEGNGMGYGVVDKLSVTLLSPEDTTNLTTSTNDFIWNVLDPEAVGITNTTIYIYNSTDLVYSFTNSSGFEGNYTDSITLNNGDYSWNATAIDSTGSETHSSTTRTFNIDTTPIINVSSPITNTNYSTSNIWFNATSQLSVDYWIINYNGTNYTVSDQSGTSLNESLSVEDGTFNLNLWANNSVSGVWGLNDSITNFEIDTTFPQISITSPSGTFDYLYEDYNLTLNTTATDTNLDSCWYEYNLTNNTISCSSGVLLTEYFNYSVGDNLIRVWANDTVGNTNSSTVTWDYKILENSRTFTDSLFETQTETYSINLTANSSLTAVNLFWDGNSYSMSQSGSVWSYTRDMPIGTGTFNLAYNFTYGGSIINSTLSTQQVNLTLFTPTNATYADDFLNISFKDENDLSNINMSIPTSTFTYYLGTGAVNKTLTFVNNTDNFYYSFSGTTGSEDLKVIPEVQYRQVSDYPQRIWQPTVRTYNSTVTNQVLYSLNTNDGIYVTYQVVDSTETTIEGVTVTSTRVVSGETIQVGAGTTDSAGTVTFWLNPDFQHTSVFSKDGYDSYTFVHFPTQASYTITLGAGTTTTPSCVEGITQTIRPQRDFLWRNEEYDFNYSVYSSYWNLSEFRFTLLGDDTNLGSNSSTTESGGIITLNDINVSTYSTITMNYLYDTGDDDCGQISGTRVWITQTEEGTEFSIWQLAQDFDTYTSESLFGFNDFGKSLISVLIIILMVGGLSRRYGIASEGAIMGILFGVVFMLDFGLGFIPAINIGDIVSINHFFTYITFIMLFVSVIRSEGGR